MPYLIQPDIQNSPVLVAPGIFYATLDTILEQPDKFEKQISPIVDVFRQKATYDQIKALDHETITDIKAFAQLQLANPALPKDDASKYIRILQQVAGYERELDADFEDYKAEHIPAVSLTGLLVGLGLLKSKKAGTVARNVRKTGLVVASAWMGLLSINGCASTYDVERHDAVQSSDTVRYLAVINNSIEQLSSTELPQGSSQVSVISADSNGNLMRSEYLVESNNTPQLVSQAPVEYEGRKVRVSDSKPNEALVYVRVGSTETTPQTESSAPAANTSLEQKALAYAAMQNAKQALEQPTREFEEAASEYFGTTTNAYVRFGDFVLTTVKEGTEAVAVCSVTVPLATETANPAFAVPCAVEIVDMLAQTYPKFTRTSQAFGESGVASGKVGAALARLWEKQGEFNQRWTEYTELVGVTDAAEARMQCVMGYQSIWGASNLHPGVIQGLRDCMKIGPDAQQEHDKTKAEYERSQAQYDELLDVQEKLDTAARNKKDLEGKLAHEGENANPAINAAQNSESELHNQRVSYFENRREEIRSRINGTYTPPSRTPKSGPSMEERLNTIPGLRDRTDRIYQQITENAKADPDSRADVRLYGEIADKVEAEINKEKSQASPSTSGSSPQRDPIDIDIRIPDIPSPPRDVGPDQGDDFYERGQKPGEYDPDKVPRGGKNDKRPR